MLELKRINNKIGKYLIFFTKRGASNNGKDRLKAEKIMGKIGIIDLGSNSARLVIAEIFENSHFIVEDELKESVRLGQDMDRDGFLKPQRVAETIKTLKMFKRLCDARGVDKIIAVATAAVRRAKNQRSFLDEIQATCGIKVDVLSEEEEATLVYRGVINSMDIPKGIILEIGGGSTKIVYYNRRSVLHFATLGFGAVTLTDLFADEGPVEQTQKIEEFFTEQFKKIEWLAEVEPDTQLIGVGGSFRNLYKINRIVRKYPLNTVHGYTFATDDFRYVYEMVRVLDVEKRKRIRGLSPVRADIMPAALAIIKAFTDYLHIESFVIGGSGLREGIMFNQAIPMTVERPISDVLGYSLNSLVKHYGCDEKHVEHVVHLSIQLFKQLRVLHKFPRIYLKVLKIAASLHGCGYRVRYYNNQQHSRYMILNSQIYGATHREIVMAAFVAGCHRKEDVAPADWAKYKDIVTDEDIEIVKKLGVLLRIANSLDRSGLGMVTGINCDVLGDSVIMKTELAGDAALEIRQAMAANGEFKRAFKKNLEIL